MRPNLEATPRTALAIAAFANRRRDDFLQEPLDDQARRGMLARDRGNRAGGAQDHEPPISPLNVRHRSKLREEQLVRAPDASFEVHRRPLCAGKIVGHALTRLTHDSSEPIGWLVLREYADQVR